jgi:Rhs element Vgr protein
VADSRTLPIAAEHREFTIQVDGAAVPREHQLNSVTISTVANRIASARLCYLDGSAAAGDFPLSNLDLFLPGRSIEILAGAGSQLDSLFHGIVVRHAVHVRDHSAPQLIVECRHAAMKLTVGRRDANYFDQSDSEVIESLLSAARVSGDIEATTIRHEQLVQFHTSDWDFLLARAEANGKLLLTRGDKVDVKSPVISGSPVCTLQFGATLLELDAEIDARQQYAAVGGVSWDAATQDLLKVDGEEPAIAGPGNLSPATLAAVAAAPGIELRHAALARSEAKAWADATWQRSRLNKVSGRGKCEGIGSIHLGDMVRLAGVGARFNGNLFVTGVRHEFDLVQGWKTHLQFGGLDRERPAAQVDSAPPAGGLLPRVGGLQIGVVVSNEDPEGEHRVRIRLPLVSKDDGIWARVASLDAGRDRGFFFRPEVGDEVVAGFLDEDPRCAVILGMLHSSAKPAPLKGSDDNHQKAYKSRSGMQFAFDDKKKEVMLRTPAGNRLVLSEQHRAIVLADQNGNSIKLTTDGIQIASAKAVTLKAGTEMKIESGTALSVAGGTELKLEGSTTAELSSSGITKVVGSMVQIN